MTRLLYLLPVLFFIPILAAAYPAVTDNGRFQCGNTSPTQEVGCQTNSILEYYLDAIAKSLASIAATELDNNLELHKQTALLQKLVDAIPHNETKPIQSGQCIKQGTGLLCSP